ncbi:radical SAM protein [Desulfococcaceae bacterium HSG9]|nr:radical SAM protein [Desulfococcaceae bacterium HSG9]
MESEAVYFLANIIFMANISLTTYCNRNCSFCFARNVRNNVCPNMSVSTFIRAVDFFKAGGLDTIHLMGGEPTLHPKFPFLVEKILERRLNIQIFTGGVIADSLLDALDASSLASDNLNFILNVDLTHSSNDMLLHHQEALCQRLSKKITLGATILHAAQDLSRLIDWHNRWHTAPAIRLGVAHPIAKGGNRFVREPQLFNVGALAERFCRKAIEGGIHIEFDCGWTPCMFSSFFMENSPFASQIGQRCNPIIDVLPNGSIAPCYALSHINDKKLQNKETRDNMVAHFETELEPWREIGSKTDCTTCAYRNNGICRGGCVARAMTRGMHPQHKRADNQF